MLVAGPHFRLLTLGVPMLVSAAGEVVRYRTRKHFALLIRLALEPGRKFVRDYLIDLLWPDAAPERGRHSLSQAITVLRTTVGREFVSAHRSTLALAEGVIDVDALRLETGDAEIRGRFLEGFDLRGARGFDEWREGWSARLQPQIRDCLVRRMDAGRRIGDFATVERHALVLEEVNPHSDDALRGIMEARAWVGDRSNALKAFNRFAARLGEDLGIQPGPDLQRMAGLLREGRRPAPRPTPQGIPPREERRFEPEAIIGREREFSALYDAWLEVRHRKPRVMVVLGDPGIGKTTLTNSFVSSCQMVGAVIARAQAYDAERELPYAVLAELVRQLTLQRAIGAAEPEALAELSRLTPDILAVFPGVPSPAEWPPDVVPLRFADAFLKAVTAAADENSVVLVVDDIHAADNASVGILHMLTRKLSGLRIMLILAGRTAELRTSGPPSALATDSRIEGLETILLDCFSPKIGSELVLQIGRLARAEVTALPVERIVRAGAGNPLAIELLTREWTIRGEESLLNQLEALDRLPAPILGIPIAVRAVFERQSRRLDSRTRSVLDLAAVLGRRLGVLEMYEIVECSPGEAASRLSELLAAGLVREVQGQLEFRNELIRAKAYYDVAEQARKQLHQRVASKLSSGADLDSSGIQLEIAWHWLRGGNSGKAMPFAIAGAETSMLVGAPSEAAQVLCALLNDRTDTVAARRVRYLLAKAYLDQSRASEAIPILESLSSEVSSEKEEAAEIALCRASAEYLLNRQGGRTYGEAASTALRAARETDNPKLLVRALFESSRSGLEIGDGRTFYQAYSEMKDLLSNERYSDLPELHYACGFCESVLWRARSAYSHIYQAKEKLGPGASPTQRSFIWNALGAVNTLLCRLGDAIVQFEEALQLSKKIGDESRISTIASNLCSALTYQGSFEAAIEMGNYAINSGLKSMNQPLLVTAYTNLVDSYVLTGRLDEARHCLSAAKEWLAHDRSWFSRIRLLVEDADLHLMCGEQDLVMGVLAQIDSESEGRSTIFQPGLMTKLRVYRAALSGMEKEGLRIACEAERTLRNECPLAHLDALAARAWIETVVQGRSDTTESVHAAIDALAVPGRRALLVKEGFLPDRLPQN